MKQTDAYIAPWQPLGVAILSEEERTRHFLATGETGSGKTASMILPALDSFVLSNRSDGKSPALIIDPKGELLPYIRRKLDHQGEAVYDFDTSTAVLWIFNQGNGGREKTAREIVDAIFLHAPFQEAWGKKDRFWMDAARALLETFIQLEKDYHVSTKGDDPLKFWLGFIQHRYDLQGKSITTPVEVKVLRQVKQLRLSADKNAILHERRNASFREMSYMERMMCLVRLVTSEITTDMASQAGIILLEKYPHTAGFQVLSQYIEEIIPTEDLSPNVMSSILSYANFPFDTFNSIICVLDIMMRPFLNPSCSRKIDANPFVPPANSIRPGELIAKGTVAVYSPPDSSEITDMIARILKQQFFVAAMDRTRLNNMDTPVFYYICDEFQRFITWDKYSGEQSFLDRCRAFRVSCILATQSIASLLYHCSEGGQKGELMVKSLMNNVAHKFFFRTSDISTTDMAKMNIRINPGGPHVIDVRPLSSLGPGECYCLFANGTFGRGRVNIDRG